jgi:membrane-bound lytic murein transglycosylase F
MHLIKRLLLIAACFIVASCGDSKPFLSSALPFPTPGQHDLVVLTTPGLLTYKTEENNQVTGLEHDLIEAFAQELGVAVKYLLVSPEEIESQLTNDKAHFAAAWLSPPENNKIKTTPNIRYTNDVIIQHEASLPVLDIEELKGKTVHVIAGSRQAKTLLALQKDVPELKVVEEKDPDIFKLMERLGERRIRYVVIDSALVDTATQIIPTLQATLSLKTEQPIVWLFGEKPNVELEARANAFVQRVQHDGTLARLDDRYFGHTQRLNQADVVKFLGEIQTTLPKFRKYFHAAEALTGIDWRLIAAVAYHESHWDPNATSYTNVRGIMMLTEETADRLEVSNRLDASESILAGARYINLLKDSLPDEVDEPDRTWLALAAYNIGPGHFKNARLLAKQLKADPNSWYEMKRVLPKMAQPKFMQQLKINRARGGEAVILVENIRSYYDILMHNATPFIPNSSAAASIQRLVDEIEQRRKAYVKNVQAAKSISATEQDDASHQSFRLPTIDQDITPARPAEVN